MSCNLSSSLLLLLGIIGDFFSFGSISIAEVIQQVPVINQMSFSISDRLKDYDFFTYISMRTNRYALVSLVCRRLCNKSGMRTEVLHCHYWKYSNISWKSQRKYSLQTTALNFFKNLVSQLDAHHTVQQIKNKASEDEHQLILVLVFGSVLLGGCACNSKVWTVFNE